MCCLLSLPALHAVFPEWWITLLCRCCWICVEWQDVFASNTASVSYNDDVLIDCDKIEQNIFWNCLVWSTTFIFFCSLVAFVHMARQVHAYNYLVLINALCDIHIMTRLALACLSHCHRHEITSLCWQKGCSRSSASDYRRKTRQAVSACLPSCHRRCIVFIMSLWLKNAIWNLFDHLRFSCIQIGLWLNNRLTRIVFKITMGWRQKMSIGC